jgi:hypothetical protein
MKSVIIHAVLAVLGLSFAYQTWTRPPEQEQPLTGEVTILECPESQLASLELETPTHTVRFTPARSGQDTAYWARSQRKKPEPEPAAAAAPKAGAGAAASVAAGAAGAGAAKDAKDAAKDAKDAKPADAAKAAAEPPKPAEPEKKQARTYDPDAAVTFLASTKFDETLKSLAPLRGLRSLGEVPKSKDAEFGFDKVGTFLRIECGGKKVALDIGGRTYGAGDRYARDPKTRQSYLLPGALITDLQSAQFKFMQAELNEFTLADVDEAEVSALGKQRKLLQRNRAVPNEARWVDAAEPDKRNELFANWFQRISRLKAKAYLGEGEEPSKDLQITASAPKPVMTMQYKLEGKPKDKVELVRVDTDQGSFYYARTGTTRRWVTLYDSLAKQVEEDVAMVVGAEEQPAQSVTPADAADGPVDPHSALPPGHP